MHSTQGPRARPPAGQAPRPAPARLAAAALTSALLAACGGGGGDAGTPASGSYDLDALATRLATTASRFEGLTGTDNLGNRYTASIVNAAAADGLFEGVTRRSYTSTQTLAMTGGPSETVVGRTYFSTGPYREYGTVAAGQPYTVVNMTASLPTTAQVGQSGAIGSYVAYADSSKTTVEANATLGWSLEAGSGGEVWACSISTSRDVGATADDVQKTCYRTNAAGELLAARITLTTTGFSLTLQ